VVLNDGGDQAVQLVEIHVARFTLFFRLKPDAVCRKQKAPRGPQDPAGLGGGFGRLSVDVVCYGCSMSAHNPTGPLEQE
jgi:hypothetical protein